MIIYVIENTLNGKKYVGQTTRTLDERMKEHFRHSNTPIDKEIKKVGKDNFDYYVIDEAHSIEELYNLEQHYIKELDTMNNGYNCCYGGKTTKGYKHLESSKKAMSDAKKELNICGVNNPFFGKKHTQKTKEKMSEAWKNREMSEEWKQKLKDNHPKRKVLNITTGETFDSIKQAAEVYNLKATHISRVCRGKRKTTGGFAWKYID